MCALKLGGPEDEKRSEYHINLKVWKMMNPNSQAALRRDDSVNIGLVKDNEVKTG